MGTVGYPLSTMRGTKELLHATYDVFTGERCHTLAPSSIADRRALKR